MAETGQAGLVAQTRQIGITQRPTPITSPWTGDLRVRYTDFQVNEIGEDGKVLHLKVLGNGQQEERKSQPAPKEQSQSVQEKPSEATASNGTKDGQSSAPQPPAVEEADIAILADIAGEEFAKELVQLFGNSQGKDSDTSLFVTSIPLEDKAKRSQVHQEVRRIFNSRIETSTNSSGSIVAKLTKSRGAARKRGKGAGRGTNDDRPSAGQFLHFTLYKENRDTMDAINTLARFLKVKPQVIAYAGTKDRRASTVQRCSVRYIHPNALAGLNNKIRGVFTGDYEYNHKTVHLGQLLGNEFTITIKKCQVLNDGDSKPVATSIEQIRSNVQSAMDHMTEHGWINYFGHQRFGTYSIGTHDIGKMILGERYEDAVNALMHYDPAIAERADNGEVPNEAHVRDEFARARACMLFQTGRDEKEALNIMPRRFAAELAIIRHLTRQGKPSRRDFVGALMFITRGLRSMFLHAYQSYVWNHAASRRWELHGEKVVKGDLVIAENETPAQNSQQQDDDGDDVIHPPADDDDDAPVRARPVTEEEASSGRFTIFDVVLPTPGYDLIYPDNEIGTFYETFMAREENGSLDPHNMRRMRREFSLPGRYRKLMNRFLAKPSFEVKAYTDETQQMHPTDMDLITSAQASHGRKRAASPSAGSEQIEGKKPKLEENGHSDAVEAEAEAEAMETDVKTEENKASGENPPHDAKETTTSTEAADARIAVVLRFQLGKSAYATVVLREIMGDPPEGSSEE